LHRQGPVSIHFSTQILQKTTMTEATQDILVHTEAGVTTITFNRVDKKNSITTTMYAAMADALVAAQADASVRVVVFQGDVAVFSAGNDIGDFLQQPPATQDAPVFRFLRGIAGFTKPVIAAVCGPAVGIGTTMLLHCDLVYAGDNAAFSMPFVNLGLCPEAASSLLVPQMMGYHRAAEALLLGEPFMAEAAQEVGLVNRVVPPTECNAVAQAQARKLAAKPLSALIETKRLMKQGQAPQVLAVMAEEGASFGRMLREPAAREAFGAFMAKRKPDFSNC
jgi:enoyl-CoA hydratase/carnithine racemase